MENNTILLSHKNIIDLKIDVKEIAQSISNVLIAHSKKETFLQKKLTIRTTDDAFFTAMPCGVKEIESLCNKTICRPPSLVNDHPSVFGNLSLYDFETNQLHAVMDATWLTSMRTGCVAALSALKYSRSNSTTVSIMGMGNTAVATLLFISELMPEIKNIKILKYKNHFERVCERFKHTKLNFIELDNVEDLFVDSDIIITCQTFSEKPFVKPEWMFEGMLAIPVHMRGWQDCDKYFDRVFTDDYAHTKDWLPKFSGELGEVLSGNKIARENYKEKIICYNYGIAIEDLALANLIYDKAKSEENIKSFIFDDYTARYYI